MQDDREMDMEMDMEMDETKRGEEGARAEALSLFYFHSPLAELMVF